MKNTLRLLFIAGTLFTASCCQHGPANCSANENVMERNKGNGHKGGETSQFIPVDSANKMINSYLMSINGYASDTALDCIIVDADMLRAYLDDSCNGKIAKVKLMLAHTLDYINNGNAGVYCGYQPGALTLLIAGYDAQGNYIVASGNTLLDHGMPCPAYCPRSGNASNNMIVTTPSKNKK